MDNNIDNEYDLSEPKEVMFEDELAKAEECAIEDNLDEMERHLQNAKYSAMSEKKNIADRMKRVRGMWEDSERVKAAINDLNDVAMHRIVDIDGERRALMGKLLGLRAEKTA